MARAKARKTRRAKQRRSAGHQRQPIGVVQEAPTAAPQPQSSSFAEEYQYVIADLKLIFILAAAMLALLVVLAVVLR
jgi:hypothetical protein